MLNKIKNLVVAEEGQGLSEYGLLLAGVVAVVAVGVVLLQDTISKLFTNLWHSITGETVAPPTHQ